MTETEKYALQLFEGTDNFDYKVINENFRKIAEGTAPSGYGLGVNPTKWNDDANTLTSNGWYRMESGMVNGTGTSGVIRVDAYSTNYLVQTAYRIDGYIQERVCKNGVWDAEWSWRTYPLTLGVEYRTTERYDGRAVYAKAIYISGILTGSTYYHKLISPVTNIVFSEFNTYIAGQSVIYNTADMNYFMTNNADEQSLTLVTTTQLSGATGILTVKYTKY